MKSTPGSKKDRKRRQRRLRNRRGRSWCRVYGLKIDGDEQFHYVGQTRLDPEDRLSAHFKTIEKLQATRKRLSAAQRWLSEVTAAGSRVVIQVIDDSGIWNVSEIVWIDRLANAGHPLKNVAGRIVSESDLSLGLLVSPLELPWRP